MKHVFILIICFLLGLIGVIVVNRKQNKADASALWLKFAVYNILIIVQMILMAYHFYFLFAVAIVLIGCYEIAKISKSKVALASGIFTLLLAGGLFVACTFFEPTFFVNIFVLIILFDGFSQIFGQLFGKTLLLPNISPKKTLEGLFGGFAVVVFVVYVFNIKQSLFWVDNFILTLSLVAAAFFGDTLASYFKRLSKVKDYSNLLPGQGGFLDRFDALILATSVCFVLKIVIQLYHFENIVFYLTAFSTLFFIAEFCFHSLKVKVETSRKLIHLFSGVICLSFPFLLNEIFEVLLLTVVFLFTLLFAHKIKMMQSLNSINRKSYGSYYFPVAIFICFLSYKLSGNALIYYYLPIAILTFSDGFAALFGKKFPYGQYTIFSSTKTVVGSAMFFIVTFALFFVSITYFNLPVNFPKALLFTLVLTAVEAVSQKGSDNLWIPLVVLVLV